LFGLYPLALFQISEAAQHVTGMVQLHFAREPDRPGRNASAGNGRFKGTSNNRRLKDFL